MILDEIAHHAAHEAFQAKGYTGTFEEYFAELRAQRYATILRSLASYSQGLLRTKYPEAHFLIAQVLSIADKRFSSGNLSYLYDMSVTFDTPLSAELSRTTRPATVEALRLDIKIESDNVDIRCQIFDRNGFRRDRHFRFLAGTANTKLAGAR